MATNLMTIPTNTFQTAYSGMGQPWQDFSTQKIMPIIQQLLQGGAGGYRNQVYGNAIGNVGNMATTMMKPAIQNVINSLSGRNMINSTVAGDTMSKAMTDVATPIMGYQAGLESQAASEYPKLLQGLAGMGQYSLSQDPLEAYKLFAQMLSGVA
jgi:hypothetical protein